MLSFGVWVSFFEKEAKLNDFKRNERWPVQLHSKVRKYHSHSIKVKPQSSYFHVISAWNEGERKRMDTLIKVTCLFQCIQKPLTVYVHELIN